MRSRTALGPVFCMILALVVCIAFTTFSEEKETWSVGEVLEAGTIPVSEEKTMVLWFGDEKDVGASLIADEKARSGDCFELYVLPLRDEMAARFGFSGEDTGAVLLDKGGRIMEIRREALETSEEARELCRNLLGNYRNPDGTCCYVVHVVNGKGEPVRKAYVQLCDANACRMEKTDDSGTAVIESEPYPYEVHIIKVPSPYEKPEEGIPMWIDGGEITVVLQEKP